MSRSVRVPGRLSAALALVLVVSCDSPVCGCLSRGEVGVIYGRVTDPGGYPVHGAVVQARYDAPGCVAPGQELGGTVTRTDGSYRAELDGFVPRPGDCLRAYAFSPAQREDLRGSDSVAFAVQFNDEVPYDSVRVDLVLRVP